MKLQEFIDDLQRTFILHAVITHFVNGLVPVAVFFLLLALARGDGFALTAFHLVAFAAAMAPVAFLSGIRDWRRKFHGASSPVFLYKIRLSLVLMLLCAAALTLHLVWPESVARGGVIAWLYRGFIFLMLPVVILLGHYGGKLAYAVRLRGTAVSGSRAEA